MTSISVGGTGRVEVGLTAGQVNEQGHRQAGQAGSLFGSRRLTVFWAVARFPLLLIIAYLLRDPLLDLLGHYFSFAIEIITETTISIIGTPLMRILLTVGFAGGVLVTLWSARLLHSWGLFPAVLIVPATVLAAFGASLILLWYSRGSYFWALVPTFVLAVNLRQTDSGLPLGLSDPRAITFGVGLAETVFPRRYVDWVYGVITGRVRPRTGTLAVVTEIAVIAITAGWLMIGLGRDGLVAAEQRLRMSPEATRLIWGNFNDLALSQDGKSLFVTGHGLRRVRKYDVADFDAAPQLSNVVVGAAQSFTYMPERDELYVFDTRTSDLMRFDGATMQLKLRLPVPDISPGDVWMTVEPKSGAVVIVSEADDRIGHPFMVIDRDTGAELDHSDIDAGSVLRHPTKPLVYLSYFRRLSGLQVYDIAQRKVTMETTQWFPPLDRLTFNAAANEVLVTVPTKSRVLRIDPETLQQKGEYRGPFGVRVLAIDAKRNWMLAGSLASGKVAVIDLASGETLKSFYLGPWIRTIVLNPETGTAYVSSNGALYRLRYTEGQ